MRRRAPERSTVTVSRKLSPIQVHTGAMIASDALKLSSDAEVSTTAVYNKKKEFYMAIPGTYRVKFDLKRVGGAGHGRIYLNGAAHGTEHAATGAWVTHTEDLRVDDQDLLQLYLNETAAGTVYAKNFRLYGTVSIGAGVENAV